MRPSQPSGALPFRVLIVDVNPTDLLLAQLAFEQQPYPVLLSTATSGQDALQQVHVAGTTPDLILLDIHMPGLNGFDVLQALKTDAALQTIPVLMFTTSPHQRDLDEAQRLRADGYLLKQAELAVTSQQFMHMLERWCVQRHA